MQSDTGNIPLRKRAEGAFVQTGGEVNKKNSICGIERAKNEQSTCNATKRRRQREHYTRCTAPTHRGEKNTAEKHTFRKRFKRRGEMHGGIYVSHMLRLRAETLPVGVTIQYIYRDNCH